MATLTRQQIDMLLQAHGINPTSPAEKVRSVLLSAHFSDDEINSVLLVLHENTTTKQAHLQDAQRVFRSDKRLSPAEISNLLGIDVDIKQIETDHKRISQVSHTQFLIIVILAIGLAVAALTFFMYSTQVGFFHPSAGLRSSGTASTIL